MTCLRGGRLLRTAEMRGCRMRAGSFAAFLVRTVRLSSWRPPPLARFHRACKPRLGGGSFRSVSGPCVAGRISPDDLSIQNGGVDRMSDMSSILCIPLYQDAPSHNEPE